MIDDEQIAADLAAAFKEYTDKVVILAQNANQACTALRDSLSNSTIETNGTTYTGNGRRLRDYENALEELKGFIQNKNPDHLHNHNLKRKIGMQIHAIRGLEVELVHGDSQNEHLITAAKVRGLISVDPADGNEAPTYSSKSSSSRIAPI